MLSAQPNQRSERLAALLLSLLRFTEWPPRQAPLVLGLLPNAGLAAFLTASCAGRQIQGRSIQLRSIQTAADAHTCDLLFLGALDSRLLDVFLHPLAEKPVLTVGESDSFHSRGGIVRIHSAREAGHFSVHLENLGRSGLRISSKLLRLGATAGRFPLRSQR